MKCYLCGARILNSERRCLNVTIGGKPWLKKWICKTCHEGAQFLAGHTLTIYDNGEVKVGP